VRTGDNKDDDDDGDDDDDNNNNKSESHDLTSAAGHCTLHCTGTAGQLQQTNCIAQRHNVNFWTHQLSSAKIKTRGKNGCSRPPRTA